MALPAARAEQRVRLEVDDPASSSRRSRSLRSRANSTLGAVFQSTSARTERREGRASQKTGASRKARSSRRARPYADDELDARRRAIARPRLLRPVAWIVLVAVLLTGVVVLNVMALRERMESDRLSDQVATLRDDQHRLQTELARATAYGRIEFGARRGLGLVDATDARHIKLPAGPRGK